MSKGVIIYDKMISPQTYLEMMTGSYYLLNAANQLKQVEDILDEQFGEGACWSHALDDIGELLDNDVKVVLVEIVNINDDCQMNRLYRWFEVPEDWTKEVFKKRLSEI